jgi:hypothetical protein
LSVKKKPSLTNGAKRMMRDVIGNTSLIDNAIFMLIFPIIAIVVFDWLDYHSFGIESLILILNNIALIWLKRKNR